MRRGRWGQSESPGDPRLGGGLGPGTRFSRTALRGRRSQGAVRAVPPTPTLSHSAAGVAPEQQCPGAPASATNSWRIPVSREEGARRGPGDIEGAETRGGPWPRLQGTHCPAGSALGRSPRIPIALGRSGDKLREQPGARWPGLRGKGRGQCLSFGGFPSRPGANAFPRRWGRAWE